MKTQVFLSPPHPFTLVTFLIPTSTTSLSVSHPLISFQSLRSSLASSNALKLRASFKSRNSFFRSESQLSDAEQEEEDYEEEDEDDDDDDVAADEYDEVSGDVSDGVVSGDEESDVFAAEMTRHEAFKWQRVDKLRNEVREFGEEIIDVDELASVYDFRIDKFQRLAIQAFLRGSSVVVSAPTSSGKTLIAEAAGIATVARGRRIFYTTPLKALSNQKFREFRYQ